MADLGIARINNDMDTGGTVTRADLADVVHRRLGLSRAESAGLVELPSLEQIHEDVERGRPRADADRGSSFRQRLGNREPVSRIVGDAGDERSAAGEVDS